MDSKELRESHIRTFSKLSLSERLTWAFTQNTFLGRFMGSRSRRVSQTLRRNGKKYFKSPDLAQNNP